MVRTNHTRGDTAEQGRPNKFLPAVSLLCALLTACATTVPSSALKKTEDGSALLGRGGENFRIAAHSVDVQMKAPTGWRVALSTEEPLDFDVVCVAPDKKMFVTVFTKPFTVDISEADPPDDYLAELRSHKDEKIVMDAEGVTNTPDGRQWHLWRFHSGYWGQHLYVSITEGHAAVNIEVSSTVESASVSELKSILQKLLASYKTNRVDGSR